MISEISFLQWKDLANLTTTDVIQDSLPWQNILYSSQFVGKDFVSAPRRRYFGIFENDMLVSAVSVYRLSQSTGRIRTPYCLPQYRKKGLTRTLINHVSTHYDPSLKKYIGFVTEPAVGFFEKVGYRLSPGFRPFFFEMYNPAEQKSSRTKDMIYLMEKVCL